MLLKCENLSSGYNGESVLENMNFEINEGELWCILGANGIGKSTLFKTVLGLLKPVKGTIRFYDKELYKWSRKELAKIVSYVPQSHIPPFPYKVMEVLMMGRNPFQGSFGKVCKKDLDIINETIEKLEIRELANRTYTQLSGGERQLVLLARAIVQDTPLMILDEPVSNLDFGNKAKVIEIIRNLVKNGKSIIMTTHEPDHAFINSCNVVIIQGKNEVYSGKGKDIVDERCIDKMYNVNSRILVDPECGQKTCIPIYK